MQQIKPKEELALQVEEKLPEIKPTYEIKGHTLSSLKKQSELLKNNNFQTEAKGEHEVRPFNENDMRLLWLKFAQKMEEQGSMNLNSILTMSNPVLHDNFLITYELPNESTKYELERNKPNLLGYLRGMLHNHDIQLEVR